MIYERFTDRARKVMELAQREAKRFHHEYIGTEHILLGLLKEGDGCAALVLESMGISLRKIRLEVEKLVISGPFMVTIGKLPQTPRAKKVIEYSMEEARNLNHNYVGTEHILLGLLREQEGVAAQVLMNLGLKLDVVRAQVLLLLGFDTKPAAKATAPEIEADDDDDDEEDCSCYRDAGDGCSSCQPAETKRDDGDDKAEDCFPLTIEEKTRIICDRALASLKDQLEKIGATLDVHLTLVKAGTPFVVVDFSDVS